MKNNCNVARDLMPLVIDGVASEDSQRYVDEHVSECTECANTYGEMRVELPRADEKKGCDELEKTAMSIKKRRIRRGVAGALAGILIFFALTWAWNELEARYATETKTVGLNQYTASIVRSQSGEALIILNMNDGGPKYFTPAQHFTWGYVKGNDKTTLNIEVLTNAFPRKLTAKDVEFGKFSQVVSAGDVIGSDVYFVGHRYNAETPPWDEIAVICGDERLVIYHKGEEIPLCSEALEAYANNYRLKPDTEAAADAWRRSLLEYLEAAPELQ